MMWSLYDDLQSVNLIMVASDYSLAEKRSGHKIGWIPGSAFCSCPTVLFLVEFPILSKQQWQVHIKSQSF